MTDVTWSLLSSRCRKIRNDCEKQRRDRLNAYIGELARLVPVVTTATRRIDKSSILRLAVNYLQVHHGLYSYMYPLLYTSPLIAAFGIPGENIRPNL